MVSCVDHDAHGRQVYRPLDYFRVMAQHHRDLFDAGSAKIFNNGFKEGAPLVGEQRLVAPHAPGLSRGENQAGNHVVCWAFGLYAREGTLGAVLRRTAIISATMATAISSGVSAPISRPMGECTRSRRSAGTPSRSSTLQISMNLRLLPIIPR